MRRLSILFCCLAAAVWVSCLMYGPTGVDGQWQGWSSLLRTDRTSWSRSPDKNASKNYIVVQTNIELMGSKTQLKRTTRISGSPHSMFVRAVDESSLAALEQAAGAAVSRLHGSSSYTWRKNTPSSPSEAVEEELVVRSPVWAIPDGETVVPLEVSHLLALLPPALAAAGGEISRPDPRVNWGGSIDWTTKIRGEKHSHAAFERSSHEESATGLHWTLVREPLSDGAELRLRMEFDPGATSNVVQLEEARAKLEMLIDLMREGLVFDDRVAVLLAKGQVAAAAAELAQRLDRDPDDPVLLSLAARTGVAARLGEEARRLADRAVELAPTSIVALRSAAFVFSHDVWGRQFAPGMNRGKALAFLLRASALEPEDRQTRRLLAEFLARGDGGTLFGPGANLEGALAELRYLRQRQHFDQEGLYRRILLQVGHDDELLSADSGPPTDPLIVAARVRRDGVEVTEEWLNGHPPLAFDVRTEAARALFQVRAYYEARAIRKKALEFGSNESQPIDQLLARVRRREEDPLDPFDPRTTLIEAQAFAIGATMRVKPEAIGVMPACANFEVLLQGPGFEIPPGGQDAAVDVFASQLEMSVEPIQGVGFIATLTHPLVNGKHRVLLAKAAEGFRLHPAYLPEHRLQEAWHAFDGGDYAAAWMWLWTQIELDGTDFGRRFNEALRSRLLVGDLLTALSVADHCPSPRSPRLLPVLRTTFESTFEHGGSDLELVGHTYVRTLTWTGKIDTALDAIDRMERAGVFMDEVQADMERYRVLRLGRRHRHLDELGARLLEKRPLDPQGYSARAGAAFLRGDRGAEREFYLQQARSHPDRRASAINNAAWASVFVGPTREDVRLLEGIIQGDRDPAAAGALAVRLDTLMMLLAEMGQVDRAVEAIGRLEAATGSHPPKPTEIYARARIAHSLGWQDAARSLYTQVQTDPHDLNDVSGLAQKHRATLPQP